MTGLLTTWAVSAAAAELTPFSAAASDSPPAPWRVSGLPERFAKPVSSFDITAEGGVRVLRVRADKSWGSLIHELTPALSDRTKLRWRWRLDEPLPQAQLQAKKTEDAALKLCLSFDMPVSRIPASEQTLFRLAQFFTREKLPTATLCYVWAHQESQGQILPSPVTARVRYLVLNQAQTPLKTWVAHERDVRADFLKAFGSESPEVPPVSAVIVGADADNTQGASLGYVGDMAFKP